MNLNGKYIKIDNAQETINFLYSKGYYWTNTRNQDKEMAIKHCIIFNYGYIYIQQIDNTFYFTNINYTHRSQLCVNIKPYMREYKLKRILSK